MSGRRSRVLTGILGAGWLVVMELEPAAARSLTPRTTPSWRPHQTAGGSPRPLGGTPAVVRRTGGRAASSRSYLAAGRAPRPARRRSDRALRGAPPKPRRSPRGAPRRALSDRRRAGRGAR